jgi:hypothetical protein
VTGPTRASVAGRAYLDLQNLGRREKRSTEELLALYALEGFLARLAAPSELEIWCSRAVRSWPPTVPDGLPETWT